MKQEQRDGTQQRGQRGQTGVSAYEEARNQPLRFVHALMLRSSPNPVSRSAYVAFAEPLINHGNQNRGKDFLDDLAHLSQLPDNGLDTGG